MPLLFFWVFRSINRRKASATYKWINNGFEGFLAICIVNQKSRPYDFKTIDMILNRVTNDAMITIDGGNQLAYSEIQFSQTRCHWYNRARRRRRQFSHRTARLDMCRAEDQLWVIMRLQITAHTRLYVEHTIRVRFVVLPLCKNDTHTRGLVFPHHGYYVIQAPPFVN